MVSIHSHIFIKQGSVLGFVVYQNKYVKPKEKSNLKMFMENLLCAYNMFFLITKFILGRLDEDTQIIHNYIKPSRKIQSRILAALEYLVN